MELRCCSAPVTLASGTRPGYWGHMLPCARANTLGSVMWVSFALAVVATVATTYASSANIALLQHADFLYLPALYDDLVLKGGRLKDWSLPPSPYFFPDFAVYCALRVISANQDWTAIGAQALVPTGVALLSTHLARKLGSSFGSIQTLALLSLMLLAYAWRWSGIGVGLLCLAIHSGQIVMVLAGIALMLRPSAIRVGLVCALSCLTALADPLCVMAGAVPLAFLAGHSAGRWAPWLKVISLVAANVGGLALRGRFPIPAQPEKLFDSQRSMETLRAFASHLGDFDALPVYLGFGCAALALVRCWSNRLRRKLVLALLLSISSSLFCLWLTGAEVVAWGSRYLISVHVILAILAPLGLKMIVKQKPFTQAVTVATSAAALIAVVGLHRNLANIGRVRLAPLECFDRFALANPVGRCVASYWFAKPLTVLASREITVVQTGPDGVPYRWINTERHVRERRGFDCAVFNESEAAEFVKRFGEPQSSVQCEGARIMAYTGEGRQTLNKRLLRVMR